MRGPIFLNPNLECARLSLGQGEEISVYILETCHKDPVGSQSRPAKRAGSRNRVLRGEGVTGTAKRTQGDCRPCDRASKEFDVGADAVPNAEGNIMVVSGTIHHDSTGVEEQGMQTLGSHQEPGRSCYLRLERPV
jgi:hypothetical protein